MNCFKYKNSLPRPIATDFLTCCPHYYSYEFCKDKTHYARFFYNVEVVCYTFKESLAIVCKRSKYSKRVVREVSMTVCSKI